MGLTAVVYRSLASLETQFGGRAFIRDEETGECEALSGEPIPFECFRAVECRLGNVAHIGELHARLQAAFGAACPMLTGRILYSGSHAGDAIRLDEMERLKKEIEIIRSLDDPSVAGFVEDMRTLVEAAETERNPIVFV